MASCLAPESSLCFDGSLCPASLTCQKGGGCVDPGQLSACEGRAEDALCSTIVAEGVCKDGLYVSANCGNGIVADGEACDDGNAIGGDGCKARCD